MTKIIIFLGAGASMAELAPSQDDIIKTFFELNSENNIKVKDIKFLFKTMFGINLNPTVDNEIIPSFEEVLAMLEIASQHRESFKNFGFSDIYKAKRNLFYLISKVMLDKLTNRPQDRIKYHNILINRLEKENELSNTTFISLNYDLIIDHSLFNRNVNYGIDFKNYDFNQDFIEYDYDYFSRLKIPRNENPINLFKLHGSLNWLYCPTCKTVILTKGKEAHLAILKRKKCKECNSFLNSVLIPPTYYKEINYLFLQEIWHEAELNLREAEKIYFCGYSFRDADMYVKYLLKRAEMTYELKKVKNSKTKKMEEFFPEIYIINNPLLDDPVKYQHAIEERNRYYRFFKCKKNIHYRDLSFQNFCYNGVENSEDM